MSGNTITPDLLLVSSEPDDDPDTWRPKVPRGSFYLAIEDYLDSISSHKRFHGDWFIDSETGERLKVAEIKGVSRRYGALLHKHGVRRDDILHVLVGPQDIRTYLLAFGAWINGGVVSAGNPNYGEVALSQQMEETGCKFVATTASTLSLVKDAIALLKPEERPIVFCIGETTEKDVVHVIKELEMITEEDCPEPAQVDVFKDVATIMYTSGTTGRPKGVVHTHYSAFNYFANTADVLCPDAPFICNTSTYMQACLFASVTYLMKGITLIYNIPNIDFVPKLLSALRNHHPSGVILGGHQIKAITHSALFDDLDPEVTRGVRTFSAVAGLTPAPVEERIRRLFPKTEAFVNQYGTSEVGIVSCGPTHVGGRLGRLVPGLQIKVVDPMSGLRLGPNEKGEIRVKTPFRMHGYFKRPDKTKEYFDEEGFGKTGDMAYYDETGDIFFMDRLKEMIYPDKDNAVSPRDLEDLLEEHKAVKECLVWGRSTLTTGSGGSTLATGSGELINACVVLKEGFAESEDMEDALRTFANARLTEVTRITGGITFHTSLPRSPLGKLLRSQMRERMMGAAE